MLNRVEGRTSLRAIFAVGRDLVFCSIRCTRGWQEHRQLREMVRSFVENEVDPQALEHNR